LGEDQVLKEQPRSDPGERSPSHLGWRFDAVEEVRSGPSLPDGQRRYGRRLDPLEYRILNAYRDGDMKAHRREAKNCALIECAQVAAEKANWPLRDEFRKMSSRKGGGATRSGGATDRMRAPAPPAPTRAPASTPQRVSYERPAPAAPPPAPPPRSAATARRVAGEIEPRSAALFFSLRHQEALIMAKHRGRAVATIRST
jgi:hypothetical protein